jgi:hypothetical protein
VVRPGRAAELDVRRSSEIMNSQAIAARFQKAVQEELPELAPNLGNVTEDRFGNYTVLLARWPENRNRCSLQVVYREDCFEISFFLPEARGPAEQQIIAEDPVTAIGATIEFLQHFITGQIVVDVLQYHRLFSSEPYYLAFFREALRPPAARTFETIQWRATPGTTGHA